MSELRALPIELIELIFSYIEAPKDILNLTEVCVFFNDLISQNERISNKLTLYVEYPNNLELFMSAMMISQRNYTNIKITRARERTTTTTDQQQQRNLTPEAVFSSISPHIRHLELDWTNSRGSENLVVDVLGVMNRRLGRFPPRLAIGHMEQMNPFDHHQQAQLLQARENARLDSYKELIDILKEFRGVQSMSWKNVHLKRNVRYEEILMSNIRELVMKNCDAYCFEALNSCNQLVKFIFKDPVWGSTSRAPGIESFENFLVSQNSLRHLSIENIHYPRLFQLDQSQSINFKLSHLTLKNVFFKEKQHAEKFFRTQNELRMIDIQIQNEKVRNLDESLFYNNIIKTLLLNNPHLHTVIIEKNKYKFDSIDFLANIKVPSVRKLSFNVTAEDRDVELFKALVKMFPNLREIQFKSEASDDTNCCKCFNTESLMTLDKLVSLTIINSSVRSLINIYAENLHTFVYAPGKTGEYIDDFIGGFLHRHRSIKKLVIGSKGRSSSYFFVSFNLCQLIVNFLNHLESISIFNFAEVNKSIKLLCTLRNLKTMTISSQQYQQFTAKTKVECERMKIKLIPVEVETYREIEDI